MEKHGGYSPEPLEPRKPCRLSAGLPGHTAFWWSPFQGIGLDCVTFAFAGLHLLLNSLGDPPAVDDLRDTEDSNEGDFL